MLVKVRVVSNTARLTISGSHSLSLITADSSLPYTTILYEPLTPTKLLR